MEQIASEQPWAIVLAGGDGTRLQTLTRTIEGDSRPKQFSKIFGRRSLLGHTRERLRPVFSDDRIMFVVTKGHDSFYKAELADVDRSRVLEQPANRGTGVAIIHEMDTIDFSKDVLSLDASNLLVVEDSTSGWADLGNPQRVIETLDRQQIEPDWLCEIRRTKQPRLDRPVSLRHQITAPFRDFVTAQ